MNEEQELPQGWVSVSLGQILDIRSGFAFKSTEYSTSGIPILRISNIVKGKISFEQDTVYWSKTASDSLQSFLVEKGDTLLAMSGATTGKIGVYEHDSPALLNQRVARLRPIIKDEAIQKYSRLFLSGISDEILANAYGAAQPNISSSELGAFTFPLPPLPEQRRIVAKLEELFSKLDAGVAAVRRTQALLKRYRQSVLHAAVTGELTRAWREAHPLAPAETGAALLQRIRAERRAQWEAAQVAKRGGQLPLGEGCKAKYVEPEAVDMAGLPELPEGWVWGSLDECLIQLRNGISTKPSESSGLRILRISAVRALQVKIDDVRYLPSTDEDYGDFLLKTGDLLFTRYNGNPDFVGVCGRVPDLTETTVYPDKLIRGRVVIDMSAFLQTVLNTGASREYIRVRIKTTAGQAGIAGSDLKSVPVPLPPLPEQAEIVAEVERRLTVLDALSQTLADELRRAERLRQSILHQAFTGRLVPQDATDEPAAALLARLRETSTQPKTRKAKETPAAPAKEKKPRGRKPADATQIDFSFTSE